MTRKDRIEIVDYNRRSMFPELFLNLCVYWGPVNDEAEMERRKEKARWLLEQAFPYPPEDDDDE